MLVVKVLNNGENKDLSPPNLVKIEISRLVAVSALPNLFCS
jgi:hypothetical protein